MEKSKIEKFNNLSSNLTRHESQYKALSDVSSRIVREFMDYLKFVSIRCDQDANTIRLYGITYHVAIEFQPKSTDKEGGTSFTDGQLFLTFYREELDQVGRSIKLKVEEIAFDRHGYLEYGDNSKAWILGSLLENVFSKRYPVSI